MAASGVSPDGPDSKTLCVGLLAPEPVRVVAVKLLQEFLDDEEAIKLYLSLIGLEALPGAYFADPRIVGKLKKLWCSQSWLQSIPRELGACVNLELLNCANNQLRELPRELGACVNLKGLYCNNNQLEELPRELGACVNLEELWCHDNQIREFPSELGACVLLKDLRCGGNPLNERTPQTPQELQERWAQRPHTKRAGKE